MSDLLDAVRSFEPEWGIVLGSGLGSLVDQVKEVGRVSFTEVPELPPSKVPGHAGQFIWGTFAGRKVLVAQGRVHLYEGHSAREVTAGVRWMAAHGIRRLILTNAAGTLNKAHEPGTWMMLSDHLNLTGTSPLIGGPNFIDMSEVYSTSLREHFARAARERGITLHQGVYAGLLGPQYETPAEIRMLGAMGADAVGMSTVLEAIQARTLAVPTAAFSCLTNWAAGISEAPLNHAEVLSTGKAAAEQFCGLLEQALSTSS